MAANLLQRRLTFGHLCSDNGTTTWPHSGIEGLQTADWVLIDANDVIVHLFRPEVRTFYNLERMWQFGDTVSSSLKPLPTPEA